MADAAPFPQLPLEGWSGRQFGRFHVLCKLGAGGMSEVLLAVQKSVAGFARPVVLKRILDSVRHQEDFLHMFVQEAKICASLSHGNIAQLFDLSYDEGELFMVMEFVPGATLVEVARACAIAQEPIPIAFTVGVVLETAQALHYAHGLLDPMGNPRPVIHRDIAEKNIMVSSDGTTKLLDFGIARQEGRLSRTQVGTVKGTAGYMSPEQVRGEVLDGRTDVFSLGVVLHECLTGQRLFRRGSRTDEIHALLEEPIAPPSLKNPEVGDKLDAIVLKALSRDRKERFSSAKELHESLSKVVLGRAWDAAERGRFIRRHFAARLEQFQQLLGDPARTNLDDVMVNLPAPPRKTVDMRAPGEELSDSPPGSRTRDLRGAVAEVRGTPRQNLVTQKGVPSPLKGRTDEVAGPEPVTGEDEKYERTELAVRRPSKEKNKTVETEPGGLSLVEREVKAPLPLEDQPKTVLAERPRPDEAAARTLSSDDPERSSDGPPTFEGSSSESMAAPKTQNLGEGATLAAAPATRMPLRLAPSDLRIIALGGIGAVLLALVFYALFELIRRI
ncbi:MAG: serine/threonine protein kinase [Myxococcaceae bacterium]|nr:serine/threonine protein kinase [Myxococcaceae bacterium]